MTSLPSTGGVCAVQGRRFGRPGPEERFPPGIAQGGAPSVLPLQGAVKSQLQVLQSALVNIHKPDQVAGQAAVRIDPFHLFHDAHTGIPEIEEGRREGEVHLAGDPHEPFVFFKPPLDRRRVPVHDARQLLCHAPFF